MRKSTPDKTYKCSTSGLQIEEYDAFLEVDIGNGYLVSIRKIGHSIIHSTNRGNMKFTNVHAYYALVEQFIETARVLKPYVEIRDFRNLFGRSPATEIQRQVKYSRGHEDDVAGIVVCNAKGVMEIIVRSTFRLVKSSLKLQVCRSFEEAIQAADVISRTDKLVAKYELKADDLQYQPEWCIENEDYRIINATIGNKVFFTRMSGKIGIEELPVIQRIYENIFDSGGFARRQFIRIVEFTGLHFPGMTVANHYVKLQSELSENFACKPVQTYVLVSGRKLNTLIRLFAVLRKQKIVLVDSLEEVFDRINKDIIPGESDDKTMTVSQADIDEIVRFGSSLIIDEDKSLDDIVSTENPLRIIAETLDVVQTDLYELRDKERKHTRNLAESLEKMKNLTVELQQREDETQQLNEELRSANDQLFAQKEELEFTKIQLLKMNNNLENMVKERTEKLRTTVDKLNKSVTELDRFVYSASHDLSSPLKSILGLLYIARKDPDKSQTGKYLDFIESSIHNLEEVIKSMISYSRNSRMEVVLETIDLLELVNEVIGELAFLPMADKIDFRLNVPVPAMIRSDRQRLKVILHNLIGNSMKYSDFDKAEPFVEVNFAQSGQESVITISDNGIGIEPEYYERIFEMFYRGTEKSTGSGLGLFIVKETVSAIGGHISVSSIPGKKTIFTVAIPG